MGFITRLLGRGRRRTARRPLSQGPAKPGAPFVLGGRTFRAIGESTIEHDNLFIALVREMGLDDPRMLPGEAPEEFAHRLLMDLIASGQSSHALSFLLIPAGVESEQWTPRIGQETAAFIDSLHHPDDKALLRSLTLGFLSDFFEHGLGSWALSASSSGSPGASKSTSPTQIATTATGSGES